MRRWRWRIRSMMALVAVAAAASGFAALHARSRSLRERALYHLAASHQLEMENRFFVCGFGISADRLEEIARGRAAEQKVVSTAAEYHRVLSAKYQSASRHPWLSMEDDPPAPPKGNPALVTADDY